MTFLEFLHYDNKLAYVFVLESQFWWIQSPKFSFFFPSFFFLERARMSAGDGQRERENPKQAQ